MTEYKTLDDIFADPELTAILSEDNPFDSDIFTAKHVIFGSGQTLGESMAILGSGKDPLINHI